MISAKWLIFGAFVFLLAIPIPAFSLTNSTIYCSDNYTLVENITVYKDENLSTLMMPVHCDYGCDNKTMICIPSEYQQNLINFGIAIFLIIFFIWFITWSRRRR